MVAGAKATAPEGKYDTGSSAGDWYKRRLMGRRIRNRKVREQYLELAGLVAYEWPGTGDVESKPGN